MLDWIKARLNEASTWKAISALLTLAGLNISPTTVDAAQSTIGIVIQAVTAIVSLVSIIKKEKAAS